MKNRIIITMVSALFITGILSSCDLFDKADDVSFNTTIEKSFVVNNAGAGTYSDEIVLDATADPEVAKYKEKIKSIIINKISYRITNYDGPSGATFEGDMLFGNSGSLGTIEINALNLGTASSSGQEFELAFSQTQIDAIAEQLKTNNTVTATMAGTFSEGPVSFVVEVTIDAKVEADAL